MCPVGHMADSDAIGHLSMSPWDSATDPATDLDLAIDPTTHCDPAMALDPRYRSRWCLHDLAIHARDRSRSNVREHGIFAVFERFPQ
jgi:hypothetical protein